MIGMPKPTAGASCPFVYGGSADRETTASSKKGKKENSWRQQKVANPGFCS